jgi:hypothetical protein
MCLGLCDCRYFASQGFYVVVDYQTMKGGPEDNIFDKESWMSQWVDLVTQLVRYAPETHGRLLLDLINEPDGCAFPLPLSFLGTPSHEGFFGSSHTRFSASSPNRTAFANTR